MMRVILISLCFSFILTTNAQQLDVYGLPITNISTQPNIPRTIFGQQKNFNPTTLRALSEINSTAQADAYPWISGDGLRLYYTNGLTTNSALFYAQRTSTSNLFSLSYVFNIPSNSNSTNTHNFWLSTNELDVYFSDFTNRIYHAQRNNIVANFGHADSILLHHGTALNQRVIYGISFDSSHQHLYASSPNVDSLLIYKKVGPHKYDYAYALANTTLPGTMGPGQLSKDDLTYYYTLIGVNIAGNYQLYQTSRASVLDTFDLSLSQPVSGVLDTTAYNGQITVSNNANIAVFTKAQTNSWTANDLYLIHKGAVTSIFEKQEDEIELNIYPNPSNGLFNIQLENLRNNSNNGSIKVFDQTGKLIMNTAIQKEIDLSNQPQGLYFVQITSQDKVFNQKLVLR